MDNDPQRHARVPRDFESLRSTIIERKANMPKRLAQVAAFALGNPDEIAFGTTASIAAASDVQPSTLVRLAHHLGYGGFSDLQSIFRERLRDRTLSYEERLVTLEQSSGDDEDANLLSGFIAAANQSVNRLAATVQSDTFTKAVDILANAETIYLIAKRRSYPLTAHMTYAFSKLNIRHQIVASPNGVDPEMVQFATPKDAAIAASFSPYAADSLNQSQELADRGVPVIAITDSAFSPLAACATHWFEVAEADFAGFRSLSASMALTMALPVAIAERRRKHQQSKPVKGKME
ncbi:MurR/RpiR family transcriptional regulator [Rhizobium leguminosarum]|jgi:DNA-binding MurR/RpiR family transcriptional regulator|uniref:MurR/RpiR family transcriptional regulator n=1 Tax=Rhizobium leguminosarum TaxID=384 RepID=A0A444HTC3_RHILE|nr:MurR/RpiR family transcriptional regulator [Rhizobium leguminosarum]MDH6659502.1 DNA-binding MurR/RpiR family transcriptional regulator [Rhizobium sophorae]ASS53684.1 MurR/RpiR family transcriptional regulator [Rhizobium leguminosarum bv. viciae]AVC49088.1 SIS domain protein [Rhizobium leguminosarum bv. viciae]MBA8834544.1 DNA-binding MurR/RpiR family transcriptional regulator [Rhizobium leguminosarum]MBB4327450.1 DNA-binding MurR/RpiR family transcriptional regulator [Rhizobium leguminosar